MGATFAERLRSVLIGISIRTERLLIRRFTSTDSSGYLRFMLDDGSTRFLAFDEEQTTEAGARALFNYVIENYDSPDVVHAYAIADANSDAYVGSCGFAPYDDAVVECYFTINPEHRGNGFAVEATKALVASLSHLVEVRAYCHADNVAAHCVARRCDMIPLGSGRNKNPGLEGLVFVTRKDR
ncbi:hypothetical protein Pan241w_03720 [Gimesia alba]|uniref:N-acetyltransferase domain-containing protein n=1 Tax=Gimesia alba TaxID=2527973 RepID=A0A517R8U1_9PLAN|nr:GNAT family N-acetyltransferase [Gimesia alba]QDT40316.1 hypothetical protein Pan241w_03720 [Gimesia alba]